jgi:hypothetical protein
MTGSCREVLRYRGDQIVMIGRCPRASGPGALVCLDLDGDSTFERQVRADKSGWYTFSFDAAQLPPDGTFSVVVQSTLGKNKAESSQSTL